MPPQHAPPRAAAGPPPPPPQQQHRQGAAGGPPPPRAAAAAAGPPRPPPAPAPAAYPRFEPVPLAALEASSPSRAHGIDWPTELSFRKVTSALIMQTACGPNYLKLGDFTAARAVVLFNRFYARCSFHANDRWVVAPACILLASKIDNSPRTAKDVATAFYVARCEKKHRHLIPRIRDPHWAAQQAGALVAAERAVMFALNFDFMVDLPTGWVLGAMKRLGVAIPQGREPKDAAEADAKALVASAYSLLAMTWTLKDTLLLTVTDGADAVGAAALLLVSVLRGYTMPLPPGESFASHFGVSADALAAVCARLRHCFAPGTPGHALTQDDVRAAALRRAPGGDGDGGGGDGGGGSRGGGDAKQCGSGGGGGDAPVDKGKGGPSAAGGSGAPDGQTAAAAATAGPAGAPPPAAATAASAAAPVAAESPPAAHDSASSHHHQQCPPGTALASRKRARDGSGGDSCGGGGGGGEGAEGGHGAEPAAKKPPLLDGAAPRREDGLRVATGPQQQQQQHEQQQQQH